MGEFNLAVREPNSAVSKRIRVLLMDYGKYRNIIKRHQQEASRNQYGWSDNLSDDNIHMYFTFFKVKDYNKRTSYHSWID